MSKIKKNTNQKKAAEPVKTKRVAKAEPAKKAPADVDALGSREGSLANKINVALMHSRKAHTVAELSEMSGVHKGRVRGHLKWLERYEAAEADEDGAWKLKKKERVFGLAREVSA